MFARDLPVLVTVAVVEARLLHVLRVDDEALYEI
jgi:hypothetical protein